MNWVSDVSQVISRSLSFWLTVAGLLVLIVPELRYYLTGVDTDPVLSWWLGVLLLVASLVGRIWRQGLSWWREWLRIAGVLALIGLLAVLLAAKVRADPVAEADTLKVAVPFIAQEEGERTSAYLDVVGVPTICFGSTRGVRLGMVRTHAECLALLSEEVAEYRGKLHRYFSTATRQRRLTPERDAAYTSTAFNCGVAAIGRSTATRRLNAGDVRGGCQALTWWNKAGGRVIRGLVGRRERERRLCMVGVR